MCDISLKDRALRFNQLFTFKKQIIAKNQMTDLSFCQVSQ